MDHSRAGALSRSMSLHLARGSVTTSTKAPCRACCSNSTEPKPDLEACALAYVMTIHRWGSRQMQADAGSNGQAMQQAAQVVHAVKKNKKRKKGIAACRASSKRGPDLPDRCCTQM